MTTWLTLSNARRLMRVIALMLFAPILMLSGACATPYASTAAPPAAASRAPDGATDLYSEAAAALLDCVDELHAARAECATEPCSWGLSDVLVSGVGGIALGVIVGVLTVVAAR